VAWFVVDSRDTRVEVRSRGQSKINAAYAYGYLHPQELFADNVSQQEAGMALAAETVEEFVAIRDFNYRVDYVSSTLNFAGFARLIDAFEGGLRLMSPNTSSMKHTLLLIMA
jgi:anionic cell wall polymer biosynthesis LytR-Cps2A-Psr (LCP) family protein